MTRRSDSLELAYFLVKIRNDSHVQSGVCQIAKTSF